MPKGYSTGRPPERTELSDPVVVQVKIGRRQREKLRRFAKREKLLYNGVPSVSQAVAKLIEDHA